MFIVSGSGKKKIHRYLIHQQQLVIDKIYLYAKNAFETKYQFSINNRKSISTKHYNDPMAFIEYPSDMNNAHKNINDYNLEKKKIVLIVFDDITVWIISNQN